jgi:hypothetical protein
MMNPMADSYWMGVQRHERILMMSIASVWNQQLHFDGFGMIVQADMDGGDSCNRLGMYYFGLWCRYHQEQDLFPVAMEFAKKAALLEVSAGKYVRHPDPLKWYSSPDRTSRDQLIPLICAFGAFGITGALKRLFNEMPKVNKDIFGPAHLALFIRAFNWFPLWPVLWLTDLWMLFGVLIDLYKQRDPNEVDDNNCIIMHLFAHKFLPTPVSWLARKVYSTFRPKSLGPVTENNRVMRALVHYHRKESGGSPAIAELYRPLIEELFT